MRLVRVAPLLAALACASAPKPVSLPLPGPAPAEPSACTAWTEAQEHQCLADTPNAFGARDGSLGVFGGGVGGRRDASNRRGSERRQRAQRCQAVREEASRQCAQARATEGQKEVHAAGSPSPSVPAAETGSGPSTAEACPAGGFQRACWGMTEAQVRARVRTDSTLQGQDAALRERQDIAGLALVVHYHFERDGLGQVELLPWQSPATPAAAAEGFRTLRHLLEVRYGTPVALSPEDRAAEDVTLRWSAPGTRITLSLRPAAREQPLQLRYAREAPGTDTADADRL